MDLFKFNPGADATFLTDGQILNKTKTIQWVERYRDPGEFEIVAGVSSNLRALLPLGTMLSHLDTLEVMMVENVTIKESEDDEEDQITIRGRSLESYLKHRIVGDDIETYIDIGTGYHLMTTNVPYQLPFDTSWEQTVYMIDQHIVTLFSGTYGDRLLGFVPISNQQHVGPSTAEVRTMRKQNLHSAVLELLAVDDFGIQTVRPNADNVDPTTTEFRIHNGIDRTTDVIFSHAFGDLNKSEYFWSDAALKTDYLCVSNYYNLRSDYTATGYDRRVMYVDCTDIDEMYDDTTIIDAPDVNGAMDIRGQQALRAQVRANLLATDVSRSTRYKFKRDYDIGDLITVQGNYDVETVMRIAEHVTFQDEKGESGYPTLAALNE